MTTPAPDLVTLADIEAARDLIAGVVRTTPLEPCRPLAAKLGGPVWLKCEHLQRAGSFKVRGAYLRISRLSADEKAQGVVAASAGNHAQGVALAASLLGTEATVFMPVGAPVRLTSFSTIADGIAVGRLGDLPFAHISKLVDEVVTVSEEDIFRAVLVLLERCKQVVEPAGAVGVAALLASTVAVEPPVAV